MCVCESMQIHYVHICILIYIQNASLCKENMWRERHQNANRDHGRTSCFKLCLSEVL